MKNFIIALFPFFAATASFSQIDYKGFPQWSWHKQDSTEYYLYTPSQKSTNGLYPIVLFLHGCCGNSYQATLRNTVDPPVRMWHNFGANTQQVPTYIIAPATSQGWKQHIPNLKKVMDDLIANHNGDPQRIYITGFSMGGSGTWEFLQQYPDYFAAALPMGMNFHGDHQKIKDIPIWTNRGETDYWARTLHTDVWKTRKLNGNDVDSNQNWVTGTNPRFTSFKDYDHGVQWIAASSQDLTGWAYAKVNDGNKYPVVFFRSPEYKKVVAKGTSVPLEIAATDADGSISKITIRVNNRYLVTLSKFPYRTTIIAPEGDTKIEAIATDNKGKESVAITSIKTNIPATLITSYLPFARQGALYQKQLFASGNGVISFSIGKGSFLPKGLELSSSGVLTGMPQAIGAFTVNIIATDEDGDTANANFALQVMNKADDEILVTNMVNDSGVAFPISKMRFGAFTHFNRGDDEVSVSFTGDYEGMTYILGNAKDTSRTSANYLSFEVDEEATVFVAYERKDHLFTSNIPAWLKEFRKEPSRQLVAQYFYYDLFYKDFPKGKIVLPGADEKRNNVNNNYFVLVRKKGAPHQSKPEINASRISDASLRRPYLEQLTALYGTGVIRWELLKGSLPKGIALSANGILQGTPETKGSYRFTISAKDERNNVSEKELIFIVK